MSGTKYVLDTNAIIAFLQGNKFITKELENAAYIGISVISIIEFFSFPSLSLKDKSTFQKFIEKVDSIGLPNDDIFYLESIAQYKILSGLKLPDVIIASSAIIHGAILITKDKDFQKMKGLKLLTFQHPST